MLNAAGYKYKFTFERNASASYLVVNAGYEANIQNYQVEMIENNPNPGILPLYVSRKDNILRFYYDITSKVSLVWLLKKRKIKKNELIGILCGIAKPLIQACDYFLHEDSFIIDEDYIFVSPDLTEISLVYVPVLAGAACLDSYKDFVLKLVTSLADIEESPADNYLQRILGGIKQSGFSIMEFDRLLKEISCNTSAAAAAPAKEAPVSNKNEGLPIPPGKDTKWNDRPGEITGSNKRNNIINLGAVGLVFSQIFVIFILIALFKSDIIEKISPEDTASTYMGIALVIGAVDFLCLRSALLKKSKTGDEQKTVRKKSEARLHQPARYAGKAEAVYEEKEPVPADDSYETVFLGNTKEAYPFLQGGKDGITEKILIEKDPFIIGRLKEQADFACGNNAVGKLHAEILCRDGRYYIKDLNSRNGTFINNERIDSNKENEIKNNDKISLANSDYIFIVPQGGTTGMKL